MNLSLPSRFSTLELAKIVALIASVSVVITYYFKLSILIELTSTVGSFWPNSFFIYSNLEPPVSDDPLLCSNKWHFSYKSLRSLISDFFIFASSSYTLSICYKRDSYRFIAASSLISRSLILDSNCLILSVRLVICALCFWLNEAS